MSDPLPAPTFSAAYTTPLINIGSGYAAGITQAGQSIAGAITSVMGGMNPTTGEAQPGLLEQSKDAHDLIDIYYKAGLFDDDTYAKLKTSGLGAQQKALGAYSGALTAKYTSQLDQQRQLALQKAQEEAAMARTRISEAGALERQRIASQTKEDVAAERAKQQEPLVRRAPAAQATNPQNPSLIPPAPPWKLSLNPNQPMY